MQAAAKSYYTYRTPHGPITIAGCENGITTVAFGEVVLSGCFAPSTLTNSCATQLLEYFAGKRRHFDTPLAPVGSEFQQAVWFEIAQVPYAQTCTSADVAQKLGAPASFRAVGAALSKNPLAVLIPDHRMVNTTGNALGKGDRARLRHALLELERKCALR